MQGTKYENQVRQLEIYAALSWGNFVANLHTFSLAYFWRSKIWWRTNRDKYQVWRWYNYTWGRGTKDDDITIPDVKATFPKKKKMGFTWWWQVWKLAEVALLTNQKTNIELERKWLLRDTLWHCTRVVCLKLLHTCRKLQCPARVDIGGSRREKWNKNQFHSFEKWNGEWNSIEVKIEKWFFSRMLVNTQSLENFREVAETQKINFKIQTNFLPTFSFWVQCGATSILMAPFLHL